MAEFGRVLGPDRGWRGDFFEKYPANYAGECRRLNTSHKTRREMEMIQLMGTPSVDRQTQGLVGKLGSAEMLGGEVHEEFTTQLENAITGVQKKEVNPNELIAQLVGLDLNSVILPKQPAEVGADLTIDLSLGRLGRIEVDGLSDDLVSQVEPSVREFVTQQIGTVGGSVLGLFSDSVTGSRPRKGDDSVDPAPQGPAICYIEGGDGPAICYIDPDMPKGLSFNPHAADRSDINDSVDRLGEAIRAGVQHWMQGQSVTAAVVTPGLIESNKIDTTLESADSILVESGHSESLSNAADLAPVALKKLSRSDKSIAIREFSQDWATPNVDVKSEPAPDQGALPSVSLNPFGAKVGYRGTGQGRPDDLIKFEKWNPSIVPLPKPQIGPLNLREPNPVSVNPLVVTVVPAVEEPVVQIDPRELAKTPALVQVEAETAPAIIEGIAGRLTRESFFVKPMAVTLQKVDLIDSAVDAVTFTPVVSVDGAKLIRDSRSFDATASAVADTEFSTVTTNQKVDLKGIVDLQKVSGKFEDQFELDELSTLREPTEIDSNAIDAQSVDQLLKGRDVSKSAERAEVKAAIDGARQEIAEAVMDLIAARRPQTVKVQLNPVELGTIDVSVRTGGGRVDVDLRASHDGVRQGLAANRADLVRTIESGGASVSSMNVGQQLGQDAGQQGHRGGEQATREDFRHAVNLGQVSTNAETLAVSSTSYGTAGFGRVDMAA